MQHKEQSRKIKNLRAYLRSPKILHDHSTFDVHAAFNLISHNVANLQATQEYIGAVQDKYIEALGRPIVQIGTIIIDFASTDVESGNTN